MAHGKFIRSEFIDGIVRLEFELSGGQPAAVTIPLENANHVVAGVINALRAAEQRGSQIPAVDLGSGQMVAINELPVDQWLVSMSPDFPGKALLHLLAAGGLYLTYSFGTDAARFAGEALASTGQELHIDQTLGKLN